MKFWDSSALVPLCVEEQATASVVALMEADSAVAAWWSTPVECASALARLEREGRLDAADAVHAFARLDGFAKSWMFIEPVAEIQEVARRLLRVHVLRAADALQLAAAFVAAERRPPTLTVVTLDDRVAAVARKEGFRVIEPGAE